MSFVHLHVHSGYSHDGKDTPEKIAKFCAEHGHTACALTDHGGVDGIVDFAQACAKYGIKGVLGCEIYYQPIFDKEEKRYHMTVLVQSQQGLENLNMMLSIANAEKYYYYPVIDNELLEKYHQGLIFASGCISSYVSKMILAGDTRAALAHIDYMWNLVGDRYYLEVQPFPVWEERQAAVQTTLFEETETPVMVKYDLQKQVNAFLVNLQYQTIMTSDSHYVEKREYRAFVDSHHLRKHSDHTKDLIADYSRRYFHTEQSMLGAWNEQMGGCHGQEYLDETQALADRCDVLLQEPIPIEMPDLPWIHDPLKELTRMVAVGMQRTGKSSEEYKQRARYELRLIRDKGYLSYFHIVADFFLWCKAQGIDAQARGSSVASFVLYCLGGHDIDPLKYNLPFDRFLSDARTDWPDIDIDMADNADRVNRAKAIAYMSEKYAGNVSQITTFGRWQTRNLITALCKVYGVSPLDIPALKYGILLYSQEYETMSYQDLVTRSPDIASAEVRYPGLIKSFCALVGGISFIGTHAAGIALSKGDIRKRIAIRKAHGTFQTSVAKEQVAFLGMTKLDLLSVRNLLIIQQALQHAGVSWSEDFYEDVEVLKNFSKGKTRGIFQFDKPKAQQMCQQLGVHSLSDIAIITACNRPGPLMEGTWDELLKFRKNPVRPSGADWFDEDTGECFIFQEHVMEVCKLAGFSAVQVDKMLKMLKKYQEETDLTKELRVLFVDGMMQRWIDKKGRVYTTKESARARERYTDLFESMRRYLFNKAHAWSYAGLAFKECWIRHYHKRSWYLALLRNETNKDLRIAYSTEAVREKVYLIPPQVNGGIDYEEVTVSGKSFIQEGLLTLHGLGPKAAQAIVDERLAHGEYTDRANFLHRFGFVEVGDVATKTTQIIRLKPKEMKHYTSVYGDVFVKGVNTTVVSVLGVLDALVFDYATFVKNVKRYNSSLVNRK